MSIGSVQILPPADDSYFSGTIKYTDLEGRFYFIEDDQGNYYDPINLPD